MWLGVNLLPRERRAFARCRYAILEVSPMAAYGMYDADIPAAGVIAGIGRVAGIDCMIVCNDATVKAALTTRMTVKKHLRAQEIARKTACHVSIWSTLAVRTCPTKMKYSQIKTTLVVFF